MMLSLLLFGSGCVTKALWTNGNLEAWNEPTDDANLRLFEGTGRKDLLVVYDEYCERTDVTHTRAFWLNANEKRLEQRRMPDFVSPNSALHLSAIPVFDALPKREEPPPEFFYALLNTNEQSFALYSNSTQIGSYNLPEYDDGRGKVEKAALTPIAVTADLTIVGGFIGYLWLEGMASSGSTWYH